MGRTSRYFVIPLHKHFGGKGPRACILTNEATEIIFLTFFDRLEILRSRPLCDSAPAL